MMGRNSVPVKKYCMVSANGKQMTYVCSIEANQMPLDVVHNLWVEMKTAIGQHSTTDFEIMTDDGGIHISITIDMPARILSGYKWCSPVDFLTRIP